SIINQNPESGTASDLTLAENMRLAYLRGSTKSIRIRLDAKFKEKAKKHLEILKMGLENKIELKAKELSGGQRQALTLAMATFNEFSILVLDEPTAALDPKSANQVNQYIKHIMKNKGICSVMVTHNLNDAVLMGNRIIYMDRGVIIKDLSGLAKESLSSNDLFSWFKS
ncbi:MAG TPA: ATP-binding cassette domain-containing protein, partial [Bacteroidia bacterium]|nr:ATP-binding cassette domain-containing protein [Bacteroidia bacterium]